MSQQIPGQPRKDGMEKAGATCPGVSADLGPCLARGPDR